MVTPLQGGGYRNIKYKETKLIPEIINLFSGKDLLSFAKIKDKVKFKNTFQIDKKYILKN